jgi:putative ABC transport system ATP-binding protein
MEMIRRFARAFHQTIVLVSHDPEMAAYADRIVTLLDGEIVSDRRNSPRERAEPGETPDGTEGRREHEEQPT